MVIPLFKSHKTAYAISLLLGAAGFISTVFITNQYVLFGSYLLIGCAWAAMLALPFTILTNALSGKNIGAYLGLFNGTICLPQIVAAVLGGLILKHIAGSSIMMLVIAGILLILGAISVVFVKETLGEQENEPEPVK
jgi:maltose/moltooligosaccharide transporter